MAEPPSSPPPSHAASTEESLAWYKRQYEQLADELTEFRESSHELEAELEKDLDAADKRQRDLEQRAESIQFEADEWKEKCKHAKAEANAAQNALEKEITTLRDTNRTLTLRLRDIEVVNDDFERQARNTTSSLEDLESKYNIAIERSVMMEEEIKIGEQEREALRIDAQRLREELSDLRVEAEILQDKIKKAEDRRLASIVTNLSGPGSPTFDQSPRSAASSPLISTPPDEMALPSIIKDNANVPPSPPMSEASATVPRSGASRLRTPAPPAQRKSRLPSADRSTTPKPRASISSTGMRHTSQRSVTGTMRTPVPARTTEARATSQKLPPSASLSHIRSLTAQMQRLEARVNHARSKLPAPTFTPPKVSPRSVSGETSMPSTVTMRSRKRTVGSSASSVTDDTPSLSISHHRTRLSTSGVSRLSFGPVPSRAANTETDSSRPSSRASTSACFVRPERPASRSEIARPMSRTSFSGARTSMGVRPRTSLSGSLHSHSQSISSYSDIGDDSLYEERTPSRAYNNAGTSAIPTPRRMSGSISAAGRRISGGPRDGATRPRKLSDLGETY
ncbi:NUDE protein [Microdochium nivale]|nr:NUDE protein [Microdochium nivale]